MSRPFKKTWNLLEAVELCRQIEEFCPDYGYHVALTGGSLYKDGERKDADILFYTIRQREDQNNQGLMEHLESIGLQILYGSQFGEAWVAKGKYFGKDVDLFFPEIVKGEYHG